MIKDIRGLQLTECDDPDVGHITMLLFQNKWYMFFDFRYNKGKIKEIFKAGKEFLEISKLSFEKKKLRVFIDNLYSAIELFATCQIYNIAGKDFQQKRSHRTIQYKYNETAKIGNFNAKYSTALNQLNELRLSARYIRKPFSINNAVAVELLQIGEDMLRFTEKTWK